MKTLLQKIFIALILFLPFLAFSGIKEKTHFYHYDEAKVVKPNFDVGNYLDKSFQHQYEGWFKQYMFGRKAMILLKNTAFYFANLKAFVLNPNYILYDKSRIIGVRSYTPAKLNVTYKNFIEQDHDETFNKLLFVQKEFEKRGKAFMFILAPNSNRFFNDKKDKYFKIFDDYSKTNIYPFYASNLEKLGINYFDTQTFFTKVYKADSFTPISFYDVHWNRYGAGLVMIETLKMLKEKYKTKWDIPEISEIRYSNKSDSYERESADRLNMFFKYEIKDYEFPYIVYKKQKSPSKVKVALLGDSMDKTYGDQLIDSGFSNDVMSFENMGINDEGIKKILADREIVIIIFTEVNLVSPAISSMINNLYTYLKNN
jgi:hypothetical protein